MSIIALLIRINSLKSLNIILCNNQIIAVDMSLKMKTLLTLFVLILTAVLSSDGAKILFFFPGGTFSHKGSVWPLVTALSDRGHNVTFVSSFKKQPVEHAKVIDIAPASMVKAMAKQFQNVDRLSKRLNYEERLVWTNYHSDVMRGCEALFESVKTEPELHHIFHEDTFDIIINNVVFGDCGYVLAHRLMQHGAKLILYSSTMVPMWYPEQFGLPLETSWIPGLPQLITGLEMSLWDRLSNYFDSLYWYLRRQWDLFPLLEKMMKEMYELEKVPPLIEVERNASLVLLAVHHGTDFARSMPPFMVNIGGMQCWQNKKPFQGEMKEFLDNAKNGAVLIAFGSTIDLSIIPEYFKNVFFHMMTKFPEVQFIWRWDGPLPKNHPKNLKVSKWLPQYEILGHPNLKAFISHAGLNSVTEATCQGVPIILLPMFADQDYNAYRIKAYEVGMRLEIRTLTPEIMETAVGQVLTNEKYANNMKHLSGIMMDRPMSPVETGVYWTEFVLRHNSTSSMKPLNNLNFFQRRLLDTLVFFSFVTALTIFITFLACKRLSAKGKITVTVKAPIIFSSSSTAKPRRKLKF